MAPSRKLGGKIMRIAFLLSTAALAVTACDGGDKVERKTDQAIKEIDASADKAAEKVKEAAKAAENPVAERSAGIDIPDAGIAPDELQREQQALIKARNAGDLAAMRAIQVTRDERNELKKSEYETTIPSAPSGWKQAYPNTPDTWQQSSSGESYKVYYLKEDGESYDAPWDQPHVELSVMHTAQSTMAGNVVGSMKNGRLPGGAELLEINGVAAAKNAYEDDGKKKYTYVLVPNSLTVVQFDGVSVSDAEVRLLIDQTDFEKIAEITLR